MHENKTFIPNKIYRRKEQKSEKRTKIRQKNIRQDLPETYKFSKVQFKDYMTNWLSIM